MDLYFLIKKENLSENIFIKDNVIDKIFFGNCQFIKLNN